MMTKRPQILLKEAHDFQAELKHTAHVLVVDDEPDIRRVLEKFLTYAGYKVTLASDGLEAVNHMDKEPPDLVITDMLMPAMNGLSLCEQIRRDFRTALIPILMISAQTELQPKLLGFQSGVDDYLPKPFDLLELKARLDALLERSKRDLWCNPLTHLPASPGIEAEVNRRLAAGRTFAFAYFDIDDFKAYNDFYGYDSGDHVIKDLARLLADVCHTEDPAEGFAGHIGGDDFVVLASLGHMTGLLSRTFHRFDQSVPRYYSFRDRWRQGIVTINRQGQSQYFPLMRLSVGVVNSHIRRIERCSQLAEIASELKHHLKTHKHPGRSRCLWDSRMEAGTEPLSSL